MSYYNFIANDYDLIEGDRFESVKKIKSIISKQKIIPKSILELACGTGSILYHFIDSNIKLFGIDISEPMINIAKKKVPNATFLVQDMRILNIDKKFDLVLCLFDSINHILDFDDWRKVFERTHHHLNDDGVFIFDINTLKKLLDLSRMPPLQKEKEDKIFNIQVIDRSNNIYDWDIETIIKNNQNTIEIKKGLISETSFPIDKIKDVLLKKFSQVQIFDQNMNEGSENSNRVYFVCSK